MKQAILVLTAAASLAGAPARAADAPPDWLTDEGGILELKLAHQEKGKIDGGILRVDRNRKLLLWEGIEGDIGCKASVEAKFEDVSAVNVGDSAGFSIELKKGKPRKLVLLPIPHAEWFLRQSGVREGLATTMAHSGALTGPGGDKMTASGSAASAGPSIKKVDLPEPVVRDTRRAADAIRSALRVAAAGTK